MVTANAVVPDSVEATKFPPGAPVVSISTYVELSTCAMGVALFEGVPEALPVPDTVPLGVLEPLREPVKDVVTVGVPDNEEPPEAVPVAVSLPLGAPPVGEPLTEREPLGVEEGERVADGVPEGVNVGEGVPDDETPLDSEAVAEGVGEGEGNITPTTNSGPAYIVPAFVTAFHALVGNVPAVVPVHTLVSSKMP